MTEFTRCEHCNVKMAGDHCELATYVKVIEGKRHTFCCEKCAEHYEKKRRSQSSSTSCST